MNSMKRSQEGKSMKTALTEAPKTCTCGKKLGKPKYGSTEAYPYYHHEPKWHVECPCGIVWLWSSPNVYKKSHIWPLGRALFESEELQQ